jgi:hypothetical protein
VINELYALAQSLSKAGIKTKEWHRKYKPIPNIRPKSPCICITVKDEKIVRLSEVPKELGKELRKYGSNQGTYPFMNLAPLYRITDSSIKEKIDEYRAHPEKIDAAAIQKIKTWCTQNNWCKKFLRKYKISMSNTPDELAKLLSKREFKPLMVLLRETKSFADPEKFHRELENEVFRTLETGKNINLALTVLFHFGNDQEAPDNDFGAFSAALDSEKLVEEQQISVVSSKFTEEFNEALLDADAASESAYSAAGIEDAFGLPFTPSDDPLSEVKLGGGFNAKLRTMFDGQPCQTRYGRIGSASYPLSPGLQKKLSGALNELGDIKNKNISWINSGVKEILFAYPSELPKRKVGFTQLFDVPAEQKTTFLAASEKFIKEIHQGYDSAKDSRANFIQIFILRQLDKGRCKVVYTRQTNPAEIEKSAGEWTAGCKENLPNFPFGQPVVPFPLRVADILNRTWKQNGESIPGDKVNRVPRYHGIDLLLDSSTPISDDLHILVQKMITLASYIGKLVTEKRPLSEIQNVENSTDSMTKLVTKTSEMKTWSSVRDILVLTGLLLSRSGIKKEDYMENFPYLYGQLLKVSDELHVLYSKVMRDGDVPPKLAGGGLYHAASEAPLRTFAILGQRMAPYVAWAKYYRTRNSNAEGQESWKAGWYVQLYEKIAGKIKENIENYAHFTDTEKAQLFIGYLAAFPKKEKVKTDGLNAENTADAENKQEEE